MLLILATSGYVKIIRFRHINLRAKATMKQFRELDQLYCAQFLKSVVILQWHLATQVSSLWDFQTTSV